jgi:bile acid:Na+ symporter, BASS family
MTLHAAIVLAAKASLFLTVLALGLRATSREALSVLRHPAQLGRCVLAMYVIMPLAALAAALLLDRRPEVSVALVAFSLAPVPPLWPGKSMRAGGGESYTIGVFVASTVIALVVAPLGVAALHGLLPVTATSPAAAVARVGLLSLLLPLALGIGLRRVWPATARAARPITIVAQVVLLGAVIAIVVKAWPAMASLVGDGTIAMMVALALVGLLTGHLLGGPDEGDRRVLALATSSRHPGVAIAVAAAALPGDRLSAAAVLLYALVGTVVAMPYMRRGRHRVTASRPIAAR